MQNFISTETSSQTAMACEQAALFGATPGPDEFDNREIWNEEEALAGIEEAIHILAGVVAPDGTQLADERESLLWGFVNALHAQVQRLDRGIDKIAPEYERPRPRAGRLRDQVARTGTPHRPGPEPWRPPRRLRGHARPRRRRIPCRDRRYLAPAQRIAQQPDRKTDLGRHRRPRLPPRPQEPRDLRAPPRRHAFTGGKDFDLVAFTGGKDFDDVTAIWRSLDSIKIKYDDMVLLHGGGPGAEKIAASWAEKNGVHQVVCKPNRDRDGKAAPFRRNDVLLNFLPKGLVAFPGSGITNNMIDIF